MIVSQSAQHTQNKDSETAKWYSTVIHFIIYACEVSDKQTRDMEDFKQRGAKLLVLLWELEDEWRCNTK